MKTRFIIIALVLLSIVGFTLYRFWPRPHQWTAEEINTLRSLWIGSLPELPADPTNRFADDPRAVTLGHKLFFDTRFSINGEVSCATCHMPEILFTDGLPLGVGISEMTRKTMTIVGTAYSPWLFWDGRKDSQWAQALGPLESSIEHGGNRTQYAHLIDEIYRAEYVAIFGDLPDLSDRVRFPDSAGPVDDPQARAAWEAMTTGDQDAVSLIYANIGKAIAAYERKIMPGPSRFDTYVEALQNGDLATMETSMSPEEISGLRLFIGEAQCIKCHNGPLFTNNDFHNTGVPTAQGLPVDTGRALGVESVLTDEFNCLSKYSDAESDVCAELRHLIASGEELLGAFKPPSLRNVAMTAPYMHAGQLPDLMAVLEHYKRAPQAPVGHTELEPLHLSHFDLAYLQAFLLSLSGPLNTPAELLAAPNN